MDDITRFIGLYGNVWKMFIEVCDTQCSIDDGVNGRVQGI